VVSLIGILVQGSSYHHLVAPSRADVGYEPWLDPKNIFSFSQLLITFVVINSSFVESNLSLDET
jgi:hypothetical protein